MLLAGFLFGCFFTFDRFISTVGLVIFNAVCLAALASACFLGPERLRPFGCGGVLPASAIFFAAIQRSLNGYESLQFGAPRTIEQTLDAFSQLNDFWKGATVVQIILIICCGFSGVAFGFVKREKTKEED